MATHSILALYVVTTAIADSMKAYQQAFPANTGESPASEEAFVDAAAGLAGIGWLTLTRDSTGAYVIDQADALTVEGLTEGHVVTQLYTLLKDFRPQELLVTDSGIPPLLLRRLVAHELTAPGYDAVPLLNGAFCAGSRLGCSDFNAAAAATGLPIPMGTPAPRFDHECRVGAISLGLLYLRHQLLRGLLPRAPYAATIKAVRQQAKLLARRNLVPRSLPGRF